MNTLGPYVIFSGSEATEWCYFKFDSDSPENSAAYYTAPYTDTDTDIEWTESALPDKTPIYLYDAKENTPRCYIMDTGVLYDAPLQSLAGAPHVNAMRKVALKDNDITMQMAPKRARNYAITTEQYPQPENFSTNIPTLPITKPATIDPVDNHPSISSGGAKKTLEVTQCIQVETEANCPTEIDKGCMYVWKKGDQWSFKTNFLESIKTGIFDTQLDKDVITTLNTQPLGDITSEISSIRHGLNRPYLNLTPYQQAILVAAMSLDWPLNDKLSSDEQIQACHAIIEGGPLPESIANNEKLNSDINAFRPYLFPSTINNLYENNPHFTSKPAPTIADIILFTNYLLIGAAQTLGNESPINLKAPPKSSEVICGQLRGADNQSRLLYQGLSEGQSELFQLIMSAEMQGMEDMPVEKLMKVEPLLQAVMDPSGQGHEFIELSNDLIASIAAQQNITQEEAKNDLSITCQNMIAKANTTAFVKLLTQPKEEVLEALKANTNEKFKILTEWFFKPDDSAETNRNTVAKHEDPASFISALFTLHKAGLLTGDSAQDNFDAIAQHRNPYLVANTLISLHQAGFLTGHSAQANRNAVAQHEDPLSVANALIKLHEAGLLKGKSAQTNRDAVAQHQNPDAVVSALIQLHKAGLLKGNSAQANRDAITKNKAPASVASALMNLHREGLLKGNSAQANRDAVAQHQEPYIVADVLIWLHQAGLLKGNSAQANRDAVAQHQKPRFLKQTLIELHRIGLLTGHSAQANFGVIAQHQNLEAVVDAFAKLYEKGLLKKADWLTGNSAEQANFDTVTKHQNPGAVASALIILDEAGLLKKAGFLKSDSAQANRDALAQHEDPEAVAEALIQLHEAEMLKGNSAQVNRDAVTQHQNPGAVAAALIGFHKAGFLTGNSAQANRDAVTKNKDPISVAQAFYALHKSGLLTGNSAQANRDAVAQHQHPETVAEALTQLHEAGMLKGDSAQANRDAVAQHKNPKAATETLIQKKTKENISTFKSLKENMSTLKSASDENEQDKKHGPEVTP